MNTSKEGNFARSKQHPVILVCSSTWWPLAARLASILFQKNCNVFSICPPGHPLRATTGIKRHYVYNPLRPLTALAAAITATRPDLIIPCDDRAVAHLHRLHQARPALRDVIARSLGDPATFALSGARAPLLRLAADAGLATPPTRPIPDDAALTAFQAEAPFPWVLKRDGSWGGRGVEIVHDLNQAVGAFRRMSRPPGLLAALKQLLVNHDPYPLGALPGRTRPPVSVQGFVAGRPANCLTFCWNGEVLAAIGVEVLATTDPLGAATVVRVIDNAEMTAAARTLVRRLGLSGFCGFDFMLERASGRALLIEMNPRATQLGHLSLGPGRDFVAALRQQLTGQPAATGTALAAATIALFPGAALQNPPSPHLPLAYRDMPIDDPDLLCELLRTPWTNRSIASRLHGWWRRRQLERLAPRRPLAARPSADRPLPPGP